MLDQIDLSRKMSKPAYKAQISGLELKLGELQREARELEIPVAIVFEGWDAAGKGTLINKLLLAMDPRGFNVHATNAPTEDEALRPFLWRFWTRTPARGRFAIFDRSWYGHVLVGRVDKRVRKKVWQRAYDEINEFERQLADDGTVLIKLFLHISKETQKKRFKKLLKDKATAWKVAKADWKHHRQYEKYVEAIDEMMARTSPVRAPWTIVESHDERYATVRVFKSVIAAVEKEVRRVRALRTGSKPARKMKAPSKELESILGKVDLSHTLKRSKYSDLLKTYQKRIWEIEHEIYLRRTPVLVLFEGCDAAGKGGAIKRLVGSMDPRGYEVIPIAAPNDVEKAHHYLWRFWNHIPKAGHIAVFDRTWYGRVMVERVEGFCREDEWRRAYEEINETERQLTDFGAVLVKFWLQISRDEQLRRFRARQGIPHKRWKITDEDWRNREKWPLYRDAVDEMLSRTSTRHAPWTVVEAECKLYSRIKVLKTVIDAVEEKL